MKGNWSIALFVLYFFSKQKSLLGIMRLPLFFSFWRFNYFPKIDLKN